MSETKTEAVNTELSIPNSQNEYSVTRAKLPLHCPTPEMSKWNSHPKVFIPLEETGEAICPYCGAVYRLENEA